MKMQSNIKQIVIFAIIAIGLSVLLAGCEGAAKNTGETGGKTSGNHDNSAMHNMPPPPPQANVDATGKNEIQIVIENFGYSPSDVTIAPGTKVTWINKDEAPHTATSTSPDKKFNSGGLDTDDKFSFVFNDKGDYPYFCSLHPQMKATIKVK